MMINFVGSDHVTARFYELMRSHGVDGFHIQVQRCKGEAERTLLVDDEFFAPVLTRLEKLSIDDKVTTISGLLYNRGEAALVLAQMALKHRGSGGRAAASLLLAMEYSDRPFNFIELVNLDSGNRHLANILMLGVRGGDFLPSEWITEETDADGQAIMRSLREAWS